MCGITGYWAREGQSEDKFWEDLPRAVTSLHHRGPDDKGLWRNSQGVGLGHTRLSILDLSERGHQPMVSQDGQIAMVFNGEVYNFREIRKDLEAKGYTFCGSGDSEVVLAAFCEWREKAVERFIGMFAIAFWDGKNQKLYLFRDRLGVKPLYYGWDGRNFWFGSELKALRAFRHWQPDIDRQALGEFFQYGYISDPRSIYRQVRKLPPGHWLILRKTGEPIVQPYWSVLDALDNPLRGPEKELENQLESLLIDAFRYRLVSDVPVGVFLSGGIDSSTVTAILQRHSGQSIHTFTIGFKENQFDESPWARRVAEHLGTHHTEYLLSVDQAKDILPRWATLYDEPFGDSSGIPTWLVSKVAREQVKVALSADGGDELFGGYTSYDFIPRKVATLQRIPGWLWNMVGTPLKVIPRDVLILLGRILPAGKGYKMIDRLIKLKYILPTLDPAQFFDLASSHWIVPEIDDLIGGYSPQRHLLDVYTGSYEEQMMLWDLHYYLPADILTKVDRASMAVSLEGREPLLDHRLVEFAFRLPLNLRRGHLGSKHLLRRILYKYVPRELVDRPKQGFGIPLREWLLGDLLDLLDYYLDPIRIRNAGILNPKLVQRTVYEFKRGHSIDVNRIWLLLVFEMWREKWA
ncbi:MAG TPA: asparagine synthase (glutamine-hydrolyzing) [Candidatus Limnocylindrales bacterium]|nr:asparagine synthase (glutamine-hydrolyzing) [Candidatus Limnocylindrales bacterium]